MGEKNLQNFLPKPRWSSRFWESSSSGWVSSHPVQGREGGWSRARLGSSSWEST